MLEVLLISSVAAGGFVAVQKFREKKLIQSVQEQLPADNTLIWERKNNTINNNARNDHMKTNRVSLKEAAAIGAIGSIPSLYYLNQIDPHVLEAIDYAHTDDLSSFNDLHNLISDKYLDVFNTASADGWITRLEGYVMEQYTVDVLEKLGHDVEMSPSTTTEGWDITVDGEPWQVVGGFTPSVISEHLKDYPDVPVITNSNLAAQFSDHLMVHSIDDISGDMIKQTTETSVQAVDHLDSTFGVGIPVVTAITSGYREFHLLQKKHTDVVSSMKNASYDIAGTGGGGLAGAQAGALVGTAVGPVGTVIGAVAGGIAGAMGGRAVSNKFKEKNFNEAITSFDDQKERSEKIIDQKNQQVKERLRKDFTKVNDQLNDAQEDLKTHYSQKVSDCKRNIEFKQRQFVTMTPRVLQEIKVELKEAERELMKEYQKPSSIKRWLFPSIEDIYYAMAKSWFKERYKAIDEAYERFKIIPVNKNEIQKRYQEIINFFENNSANNDLLEKSLKDIIESTHSVDDVRKQMKKDFFWHIAKAEEKVRHETKKSFNEIGKEIEKQKNNIQEKFEKVKTEGRKLGKDFE